MNELFVDSLCEHIEIEVSEGVGSASIEMYKGEYTVMPKVEEQVLETKGKGMSDNVTVEKIPAYEVSNESGKTFIIGGV